MSLSNTVKAIQDIMRKDAGVDGDAQRIGQLGWMLFLKIYSDLELETELEDTKYKSPIPKKFRWESWADESVAGKDSLTGDALINFINNELFPKLKELDLSSFTGQARERGALLISVFDDAYNYMKNGTLLRQVINKINQDIDYNSVETRHLFGDIYEQILRDLQSAGNAGEYYTPRAVTQFAIEMLNPQLGEIILDPACGTGGFLTGAFEHMKKQVKKPAELKALKNSIRGVEKKPLPHVLCATNMMVHGIEVPSNIVNGNTLAKPLRDYAKSDQVDVIVTNPPFGGVEEDGIESNFPNEFRTKETADLFLVLVMELLKDGGRAAIVLPDGTLFGEGVKTAIKRKMLEECNLHTIVRLPKTVFSPYTNITTNILFLTKGEPTKDIWYYEHKLPDGVKAYSKTKPMRLTEFGPEKKWWIERKETEQAWKVSVTDVIQNNYNLDIKNPNAPVEIHDDPHELLSKFNRSNEIVHNLQGELKSELGDRLVAKMNLEESLSEPFFKMVTGSALRIENIRKVILNLAISGTLVEQKIEDGDAAELLAAINNEKLRILNVSKNKASKEIAYLNELPDIPKTWVWTKLDEIGVVSPRNTCDDAVEAGFIPMAQISENFSTPHTFELRPWGEIKKGYTHVRNGDVALAKITPCFENGKSTIIAGLPNEIGAGTTEIHVVRPIMVDPSYILLFLNSPFFVLNGIPRMTGTAGQKRLPTHYFSHFPFPLPPLPEQKRIVRKVQHLMSLCDQLAVALNGSSELTDKFTRSVVSTLA